MFNISPQNIKRDRNKSSFGRAVVIGGSVAGLTAARVLSHHFETVTVIERGPLADGLDFPKGVPQARHPHLLLLRGERILEELFPGFRQNLLDGGAQRINVGQDLNIRVPTGWLPQYETEIEATATSRRLLDYTIYRQVQALSNVTFKPDAEVKGLCTDEANQAVIGVQLYNRALGMTEDVPAEFVVDASGRSSKGPEWLAQLGYGRPQEQTVNAFPGYSTRIYEIPERFDGQWKTLYIMPNPPEITRGAVVMPMEGNRWHVSLFGMNRDYPPTDEDGFLAFAHSLVSPEVYNALQFAKPVSPIWGYRQAENRLRRYDQLDQYLDGFVALGDAVYALNPVYGQGITLASIANQLLNQLLEKHAVYSAANRFSGLAATFQKELAKELAIPWQAATTEDMRWPSTEGDQKLDFPSKLIGRYFDMVMKTMPHSADVTDAFYHVQQMIASPAVLLRPTILAQVFATNLALRFAG